MIKHQPDAHPASTPARRSLLAIAAIVATGLLGQSLAADEPLQVSGIYPHLTVYNSSARSRAGECGIGAVVPWAGKLWYLTYPPHALGHSLDKLYSLAPDMNATIHPESVGGTHAGRMIHRESNQLIIGPYFVREDGSVRAAPRDRLPGRITAVTRHLTDPANFVYFVEMEGSIHEVNVHTLEAKLLFVKPVPGWHGKGGYVGQGHLIVSNNGDSPGGSTHWKLDWSEGIQSIHRQFDAFLKTPRTSGPEDAGVLAEWNGDQWRVVIPRQFTDITGPGGLWGEPSPDAPVWAIGWDKRSVLLYVRYQNAWHTYRVPKADYAFDPRHGYYTEWPRIREINDGRFLMVMHGMMFDFPRDFRPGATAGLRPLASHLCYLADFCAWNGRIVLARDDTSIMQNPLAGLSQSNLQFVAPDALPSFGPRAGWGGVWINDAVQGDVPSDPFLIDGFARRCLHLSHKAATPVTFTLEVDERGDGQWKTAERVSVPAGGYLPYLMPADCKAAWVRLRADRDCRATAFFHMSSPRRSSAGEETLFAGLGRVDQPSTWTGGIIRPAGHNRNLQCLLRSVDAAGKAGEEVYAEVDERLGLQRFDIPELATKIHQVADVKADFSVDAASVLVVASDGRRFRLPKGHAAFDQDSPAGPRRGVRECMSERFLANLHGTFYEMPRGAKQQPDFIHMKPVASHALQITDFCTWRGLLVLAGVRSDAASDGHVFGDGQAKLWFGAVDDLWKLGKPRGAGGPWHKTAVRANEPSDPYLMTNYDRKSLTLSHDATEAVDFTVEVDFLGNGFWRQYAQLTVKPGETLRHEFPEGFAAHWVRLTSGRDATASATFVYE